LTARICLIAQRAKQDGFADVAAWMQRNLSADIRAQRGTRKRGVHVRLGNARGPKAFLDAARIEEMSK
jgi:hypothetical protein